MMIIPKYAWTAMLVLVLAACGEAVDPGTDATEPPATTTSTTSTSLAGDDLVPSPMIEDAVLDLARRLGVDESQIEVISAEAVTWSDGSLGCPEPGKMYTQALVDGHRIVLGHQERVFVYHSGGDQAPFLCPNPDSKDGGYEFIPPPRGDVEK